MSCEILLGTQLPENSEDFDLIILWNYRKILKDCYHNNIVIFHSSDLPEGKGWSPIFNSLNKELEVFTISAILLDEKVDSGDLIVKAKFKIKDNYTAKYIRKFDEEISIMLIRKILERFDNKTIKGVKQSVFGETFYKRRYLRDGKIDKNETIRSLMPFLRGCEESHPAFFEFNGCEYIISIEPVKRPSFPRDLRIEFCI